MVAVVYASLFGSEVTSLIAVCPGMATHPEETEFYRTFSSPEVVRNYLIPETKEEMKFFLEAAVKKKSLLSMPDSHLEIYLNKRKEQNPAFRHMWDVLNVNVSSCQCGYKLHLKLELVSLRYLFHFCQSNTNVKRKT